MATQRLEPDEGDEAATLKSIHDLFPLTRSTIKRNGRHCINFTRLLADLAGVEDLTDLENV